MTLDTIAERYVKFVLAIGLHHEYYVDAYFGPKEWKIQDIQPQEGLLETAKVLYKDLQKIETTEKLRKEFLLIHIQSCETFITQLNGKKISFDEESFLLYNAIASGADIFITADFKYHDFFDADNSIIIADIGHYESEQFTKDLIYDLLVKKFTKFAVLLSKVNTNPINYL